MMRRFLVQTGLMCIWSVLILFGMFWGASELLERSPLLVEKSVHRLVLGDSHTECAVDDGIVSQTINLSASGTAYPFSYVVLKRMLADNPQIDTVLLSFHLESVTPDLDSRWLTGDFLAAKMRAYGCYARWKDLLPLIGQTDFYVGLIRMPLEKAPFILKVLSGRDVDVREAGIGGYARLDRNKLQDDIRLCSSTQKSPKAVVDTTTLQCNYLRRIEKLCGERGVKLILFNAPMYNADFYADRIRLDSLRTAVFPTISYLDFSDFPLPDSCFGDIGHLNYRGAELFSRYLEKNGLVRDY